ncbi:hypothetical protein D9757_007105 [Collybiopsis confluens]|uniref:Aminoglycoside phosphotransferase domain-containing protein n=1 Tax=Collybiopsis confluens TaxID=2823264 RepID=A0A8H5M4V7_9AGAR|nr:hypothetical protein D9757_007105 [Collybiopsis confluens]
MVSEIGVTATSGSADFVITDCRALHPLSNDHLEQHSDLSRLQKSNLFNWLLDPNCTIDNPLSADSETFNKARYMEHNLRQLKLELDAQPNDPSPPLQTGEESMEWDWDIEHADRKAETKADAVLHGALPFEVDRKLLKDVVREKMNEEVARIKFLSAGTFHKAYLITLVDRRQVVARVARKFMPRLKTESEVATMQYLREHTSIPVPTVYHYDSNPYNRLGGEFILMSKAPGIPLTNVYHSLSFNSLVKLLTNLAELVIPLLAHRFSALGSLYFGPNPRANSETAAPTPKAIQMHYSAFPFSPTLAMSPPPSGKISRQNSNSSMVKVAMTPMTTLPHQEYHVGPIISWPFFGSNRGDLVHPNEINRGPWTSSPAYFESCVEREVTGVIRENEGKAAPHKLHLDPDEIISSRHHQLKAVPGDESDDSDEWDLEESEGEWEGPGDVMYRDYRRMQRTTFLVAHINRREETVRKEMGRWLRLMERLSKRQKELIGPSAKPPGLEEFVLDCHDLSLENVFVDEVDHSKIASTCIIDWESTTTRPLWASAHLPAFLQYSPFTAKLFRDIVAKMAASSAPSTSASGRGRHTHFSQQNLASLAREWLQYESAGMRLRMAHRFIEWDGWEEGLADSILGEEESEASWLADTNDSDEHFSSPPMSGTMNGNGAEISGQLPLGFNALGDPSDTEPKDTHQTDILGTSLTRRKPSSKVKLPFASESEKEQMLDTTGDICGGRGGELGRRLEAWLTVNGHDSDIAVHEPVDGPRRRWHNDEEDGVACDGEVP